MDEVDGIGRRRFLELGLLAAAAVPLGCASDLTEPEEEEQPRSGRLQTTWAAPTSPLGPGKHPLGLGEGRDGWLSVPEGNDPAVGAPFALLLHGAGQEADEWAPGLPLFDELGLVVLAVDSRSVSWDVRFGAFGADTRFIEQALAWTFERARVDPTRLAVAGFSDGASYALSLGLTNGDLFTKVMGFSPGFVVTDGRRGKPPVFLSHGTGDPILPVAFTRQIASTLASDGHPVIFEEFDGGHELPFEVGERALRWLVSGTWGPTLP